MDRKNKARDRAVTWDTIRDASRCFHVSPFERAAFDDDYARMAHSHAETALSTQEREWVAAALTGRTLSTIVDLGCNTGLPLDHLCTVSGAQGIGIDINASALEEARRRFPTREFFAADSATTPLADASADCVLLHHTLAHVRDARGTIREAFRILRPGGTLSIITTNRIYKLWQAPWNLFSHFRPDLTARTHYSERAIRRLLEQSGFVLERVETLGPTPALCPSFLRQPARLRLMILARTPEFSEGVSHLRV